MDTDSIKQTMKCHASLEKMSFDEASLLSNAVLSKLSQQRKDGKFCDAVLSINKMDFNVHKCVLAACSAYFETIYADDNIKLTGHKIQVSNNSADILIQVLNYIYTGQIAINTDNFAEITDLAVRFSLTKLQDHCTKYLVENINDKTCFHIHDLAKQHGLSVLMNTTDGFVFANILNLIDSNSILEVGLSSLEMLIGRSVPLLEKQRLNVMTRWIEHKKGLRKDSLPILLKLIHWSNLSTDDLNNFLERSGTLLEEDWMYFHILLSLNNADMLPDECREKFTSFKEIFMKNIENAGGTDVTKRLDAEVVDEETQEGCDGGDADDASDGGTLFYPLEIKVPEPIPPVKRESLRLAVKLKRVQELQVDSSPSRLKQRKKTETSKRNSKKKESNKENVTDALNVSLTENKGTKARKSCKAPTRVKKPRIGQQQKEEKVSCPECPFKTNSNNKLERHFKVAHKDLSKTFSCDICEFSCKWNRQFYDHLRDEHFPGPPFHCDKCGHSAISIQQLLLHRMDHSESRPHCCMICGARFKVRYVLDAHLRSHTGERPYKCTVCHRSFATKGTLDQHKNTHDSQRPYLCHLCGFSTKYQSHLKTHSRIHTGEVFKCQFANCDYKTPKRSRLACHQRSHLHVRCHTCSTCGRGFVERSHLVRHEKIHLDDRPFKCELCDYASTRRDKLNEHARKHHDPAAVDNNKMAYRPRKSRLLSSVGKIPNVSPMPSILKSSPGTKKKSGMGKQPAKGKLGSLVLESIPENEPVASSTASAKRVSTISQSGKSKCVGNLLAREAEMRLWLERSSKEQISPIKIDTTVSQQSGITEVSPNLHSFLSHHSSSSGISKGHSGSSSSGIGSQGTGEGNLISPSINNVVASDMSSPGAGSSSSQHLSSSTSGKGSEEHGEHSKLGSCANFRKMFGAPKILTVCTREMPPELVAARKKLIQERLKKFITSKRSSSPKKVITIVSQIPSPPPPPSSLQPISVVTFKPDKPPRSTEDMPTT